LPELPLESTLKRRDASKRCIDDGFKPRLSPITILACCRDTRHFVACSGMRRYLAAHPELQAEVDELGSVADLLALAPQEY
jgi:hypothetical protein